MRVLHQLGHNHKWSLDSLQSGDGDGTIIGPRYMQPEKVASLAASVRKASFFDPQFYLPNSERGSLLEYPFFPKALAGHFDTADFSGSHAKKSAAMCAAYQGAMGFEYLVAPTRYWKGDPAGFIDGQRELFIDPFLDAASGFGMPVLIQLVLTDALLKSTELVDAILNWLTGLDGVDGVYLITHHLGERRKQLQDPEFLLRTMEFVRALRANDMVVVIGYCNTEAVLYTAADPSAVTIGSYENLRRFDLKAYEPKDDKGQRGPNARIYFTRLLQWVDYQYLFPIKTAIADFAEFSDSSAHHALMFKADYNWHFSKPDPYKHYFHVFTKQVRAIASNTGIDRTMAIRDAIDLAFSNFLELEHSGVLLHPDSAGGHLPVWKSVLSAYQKKWGTV